MNKSNMLKVFQENTFKYPSSKTGLLEDRDVFVTGLTESDVFGISLKDLDESTKAKILEHAQQLQELITAASKTHFRHFKTEKIIYPEGQTT